MVTGKKYCTEIDIHILYLYSSLESQVELTGTFGTQVMKKLKKKRVFLVSRNKVGGAP